jgi:hypothetical protein
VCRENAKTSSWWGGHLAVLADSCSSKELCEFRHSENLTLLNAYEIEDVAYKTGTYALARPYGTLRNRSLHMVNRSISNLLFVSTPCDWLLYYGVHCSTPSSASKLSLHGASSIGSYNPLKRLLVKVSLLCCWARQHLEAEILSVMPWKLFMLLIWNYLFSKQNKSYDISVVR